MKGKVYCFLIMVKLRLVFLKVMMILRMELFVVVLVIRLDKMIRWEFDLFVDSFIFWIDSICVFWYIENKEKRF